MIIFRCHLECHFPKTRWSLLNFLRAYQGLNSANNSKTTLRSHSRPATLSPNNKHLTNNRLKTKRDHIPARPVVGYLSPFSYYFPAIGNLLYKSFEHQLQKYFKISSISKNILSTCHQKLKICMFMCLSCVVKCWFKFDVLKLQTLPE